MQLKHIFLLCSFLGLSLGAYAQQDTLVGISSKWDDSFIDWSIYTTNEDEEGELKMRWIQQNDWSKWDYDFNKDYGRIESRFNKVPTEEWTVYGFEEMVTMRPAYPRDYSEWRVTDNNITLTFKTLFSGQTDEWIVGSEEYGRFTIFTDIARDPRDWTIMDETGEEVNDTLKIAMVFLAIFYGSPKQ